MKFYGANLAEGSEITNLSIATGTSFHTNPNAVELFFRSDENSLYVYTTE